MIHHRPGRGESDQYVPRWALRALSAGIIDRAAFDAILEMGVQKAGVRHHSAPAHARPCACRRRARRACTQLPPAFHIYVPR